VIIIKIYSVFVKVFTTFLLCQDFLLTLGLALGSKKFMVMIKGNPSECAAKNDHEVHLLQLHSFRYADKVVS